MFTLHTEEEKMGCKMDHVTSIIQFLQLYVFSYDITEISNSTL